MTEMIIKDGVRYTPEVAKRLGLKGGEKREERDSHPEGETRVTTAPAGVVTTTAPEGSTGVVSTGTASTPGATEETRLPGSVGDTTPPTPEGTGNDGNTRGADTGTAAGEAGGSGDPAKKAGGRSTRGAGTKASE